MVGGGAGGERVGEWGVGGGEWGIRGWYGG